MCTKPLIDTIDEINRSCLAVRCTVFGRYRFFRGLDSDDDPNRFCARIDSGSDPAYELEGEVELTVMGEEGREDAVAFSA
jgi:hypothetical protein